MITNSINKPPNYIIPCINYSINETQLRISKYILGIIILITTGIIVAGLSHHFLPNWSFPLLILIIAISTCGFWKANTLKPRLSSHEKTLIETGELSSHEKTLTKTKELEPQFQKLLNELCEIDDSGHEQSCSLERLQKILTELRLHNQLNVLNAVPYYQILHYGPYLSNGVSDQLTPLHHWAIKGDLKGVLLLIENGGMDYYTESLPGMSSALFHAALCGHVDIVDALLQHGAHADIKFSQSVLHFFIPMLIYRFAQLIKYELVREEWIGCLNHILTALKSADPANLDLQLQIPINENANATSWIKSAYIRDKHEVADRLYNILVSFGGRESKVKSLDELKKMGLIEDGEYFMTEAASLK